MKPLPYRKPCWADQNVEPARLPFAKSPVRPRWQQIALVTKTMKLTRRGDIRMGETVVTAGAEDDLWKAAPLELGHRILPTGEAAVHIGGELDIATAETAVRYVKNVIDSHHGPVIVDLTGLGFCDARGLSALLRMAHCAEQAGCPFRLASPSASLVRIMQLSGLNRRLLPSEPESHVNSCRAGASRRKRPLRWDDESR